MPTRVTLYFLAFFPLLLSVSMDDSLLNLEDGELWLPSDVFKEINFTNCEEETDPEDSFSDDHAHVLDNFVVLAEDEPLNIAALFAKIREVHYQPRSCAFPANNVNFKGTGVFIPSPSKLRKGHKEIKWKHIDWNRTRGLLCQYVELPSQPRCCAFPANSVKFKGTGVFIPSPSKLRKGHKEIKWKQWKHNDQTSGLICQSVELPCQNETDSTQTFSDGNDLAHYNIVTLPETEQKDFAVKVATNSEDSRPHMLCVTNGKCQGTGVFIPSPLKHKQSKEAKRKDEHKVRRKE